MQEKLARMASKWRIFGQTNRKKGDGRLVYLYSVTRALSINPFGLEIIFSLFCVNNYLFAKDVAVARGCRRRLLKADFHSAIFVRKISRKRLF